MSLQRAAPGPRLGGGRLRVDAARAIAKLREYQLADRTGWVLEAVRAAVAGGATAMALRGDADDVWLSWHGPTWDGDELTRLFDELVSPAPGGDGARLRLLATAINSALGLPPAFLDVYAIAGDGSALRVRYTPALLDSPTEAGSGVESPLHQVAAEPAVAPRDAPVPGMVVHLRHRAGLATLSRWMRGAETPELTLARAACGDLAVPLSLGAERLGRAHGHDLLRVPLGESLDGFLALVDRPAPDTIAPHAMLEVAERGVVLARYAIAQGIDAPRAALPLRLFIDAPRMPSNASRSEVRRDGHPVAAAERRGRELLDELIERLVVALGSASVTAAPPLRRAALGLLAAVIAGPDWAFRAAELMPSLHALAALPLLRNAVGQVRPVSAAWRLALVYRGDEPLPVELAPWLADVLWVPSGDPAGQLLAGVALDPAATRHEIRRARRQRRARDRFLAHAAVAPVVTAAPLLIRARLGAALAGSCIDDALFDGLTGEVGVRGDGIDGSLALLLDGRQLDVVPLRSEIPFQAVIDAPRLTPADRYRGVVHDAEVVRVTQAAQAMTVRAIEALLGARTGVPLPDGFAIPAGVTIDALALSRMIRQAIGVAVELATVPAGALAAAQVWPTATGELVSLDQLDDHPVIGTIQGGGSLRPPAGRLVLAVAAREAALLTALRDHPGTVVHYPTERMARPADPAAASAEQLVRVAPAALIVREEGRRGAIAADATAIVRLHHHGVPLGTVAYAARLAPCRVEVDADVLVPDAHWSCVVAGIGPATVELWRWEQALAVALARAVCGDAVPDLVTWPGPVRLDGAAAGFLCQALLVEPAATLLGDELVARLRAAPALRLLGDPLPCSIDDLVARHPAGALPCVGPGVSDDPDSLTLQVMVAGPLLAAAVGRLAGRGCQDVTATLEQRRAAAIAQRRIDELRAQPAQALDTLLADRGVQVRFDGGGGNGWIAVGSGGFELHVFVEGRPVHRARLERDLPLVAVVDVGIERLDELTSAPERVVGDLTAAVRLASITLVTEVASVAPTTLVDDDRIRALVSTVLRLWRAAGRTWMAPLQRAEAFVAVQGGRASLEQASRDGRPWVSTWTGEWLGPDAGEPADPLDAPLLCVPQGAAGEDLLDWFAAIVEEPARDVTGPVSRLQAQRRMSRGLLPVPSVIGAPPALRRRLGDLGELARALAPGEIALSVDGRSEAWLHVHGEPRVGVAIEVRPSVRIAIEAPQLVAEIAASGSLSVEARDGLTAQVRPVAIALARELARGAPGEALPVSVRRDLRRALLGGVLGYDDVAEVALFETTTGAWLPARAIDQQIARFGDAWFVAAASQDVALDPHRLAFRLDAEEAVLHPGSGVRLVDGTDGLARDATIRRNRARPAVDKLELTDEERAGALMVIELSGDGTTGARGLVAPLHPAAAALRGVRAHRGLWPFVPGDDPCSWPTVAVVDDARLTPEPTYSQPRNDDAWRKLRVRIRAAAERSLGKLWQVPAGTMASLVIQGEVTERLAVFRGNPSLQVRGVLWLIDAPRRDQVRVISAHGDPPFDLGAALPLAGRLMVVDGDAAVPTDALRQLCHSVHLSLLRQAFTDHGWRPATATTAAGTVTVPPLPGLPEPVVRTEAPSAPPPIAPAPSPAPPPAPAHPLQVLADLVHARLRAIGAAAHVRGIDVEPGRATPLAQHGDDRFALAGESAQLRAIELARRARSPWADAAIDALTAHLVTVLNVELTTVTDVAELHALGRLLE